MENLSLSELYTLREQVNFELIEADAREARQLIMKLDDIESWILLKEGEKDVQT